MHTASFRFYEELNDFLPAHRRKRSFEYQFNGTPSVKDAVEAIGIPHTEVDIILVDGKSVGFDHRLSGGERVAVYPVFESLDVTPLCRLRPQPLRTPRFVLDVHLGTLARQLRMLGFDSSYRNDFSDEEIVAVSLRENRIILTRDLGILKHRRVTHGYRLRSTTPAHQLREVVARFDLVARMHPFSRCPVCNGELKSAEPAEVRGLLPRRVAESHEEFSRCADCRRVYWKGSHYRRMAQTVEELRNR